MTLARTFFVPIVLSVIVSATPTLVGQQVYVYSVEHPFYGEVGTLTYLVKRTPEEMRIESHLRIQATLLGIVLYHQETDITEVMRGHRLLSLQSVSDKDGRHLKVHGEARGDQFVVDTTAGSFTAPAAITPADPWFLDHTGEAALVYSSTGRISDAHVSGGDYETVSVSGTSILARHFVVLGYNRQDVWLDSQGVPVMFHSVEDGTTIDFELESAAWVAARTQVHSPERPVPARSDIGSK